MNGLRAWLAALAGLAVGIVTLRAVRERRASPRDEAETAVEETEEALEGTETETAAEHAVAAAGHARVAIEKTIEYATEEPETATADAGDSEEMGPSSPARRLRRVGKGWIRR